MKEWSDRNWHLSSQIWIVALSTKLHFPHAIAVRGHVTISNQWTGIEKYKGLFQGWSLNRSSTDCSFKFCQLTMKAHCDLDKTVVLALTWAFDDWVEQTSPQKEKNSKSPITWFWPFYHYCMIEKISREAPKCWGCYYLTHQSHFH